MIKKKTLCLLGPTGSGKTAISLCLAEQLSVNLISVDSAMVYRGMDIGTAKPSAAILSKFPHHLVDICDPTESYSAAQFCQEAQQAIAQTAPGSLPVLVGGTMMYFRALRDGLAAMPAAAATIRERIMLLARDKGWPALHEELRHCDPISYKRIDPNDPQRIQRALEVFELTGKPLSFFHQQATVSERDDLLFVALVPGCRAVLHERIAIRFEEMLCAGFIDEVALLRGMSGLSEHSPAVRCVGYRQIWQYLQGQLDMAEMRERALAATRQLAKRQLTWLRRWPELHVVDSLKADCFDKVRVLIEQHIELN